jgi:ABC-2 type transport system ATP-binding protein
MISVRNLSKKYGSLEVLKEISFQIDKGKIYGFLGQNGAGKTTTMNILAGLIDFNGGEINFDGKDFRKLKGQLLPKIGYLTQDPVFYNYMNAYEYLKFIGEINNMSPLKIKQRSDELLAIVKLKDSGKRRIGGYSGGMKQRMGLAVALFNDPEILFLDEPTSALDPEGRLDVLELINDLKSKGATVFLSTHILNDVERVCDEVSIIDKGRILLSQSLEDLRKEYVQPIYDIEFEEECANLKTPILAFDWVNKVVLNGTRMSVFVKDIQKSKHELFKILVKFNNPIIGFNLRNSTLEDIFLRMVNKNGDI